uniref:GEVED domain-containing protein n=1 Tax=Lutibacter sp. TaxID=1925666 RepID=UPI0035695890
FPNSTTNGTKSWVYGNASLYTSGASGNYVYSDSPGNSNKYKKDSYILATSPVISTVGHSNITFQFDVWYNTGNQENDGVQVQYSFNGSTWSNLGDPNDSNWYNDWYIVVPNSIGPGWSNTSGGWVTKSINLSTENSSFNNNSYVQFRVVFASTDYSSPPNNSGAAFDNILITKPAPTYCTPTNINTGYSGWNLYISNVIFGTFNNPTTGTMGTFNNFTSLTSLNAVPGGTLSGQVSLAVNGWNSSNIYDLNIWVDFNQDYDFDDADEHIIIKVNDYAGASVINVPINFPVPSSAIFGNTRMRISVSSGTVTSCDYDWQTGEVEDYTVNIANCTTNIWTGAISADWNNAANWSCGGVPTITTNVLIPASAINYPEIYSSDAAGLANNIELETGTSLIVYDNYIQIAGNLLLNGFIDLDGEGQLIQNTGSTLDNASTGYIERDQQGQGNKFRYNQWSSPVIKTGSSNGASFSISDVLRDGTIPSSPGPITYTSGYNGSKSPTFTLSTYWMYKFANSPDGSYASWFPIGSTGSLNPGEGYTMKGAGNPGDDEQNYVFVGKPNNGTITLTVGGNNDYLVGNPYPSALDADQFLDDNTPSGTGSSITGTLYFWEHYGGNSHNLKDYQAGFGSYTKAGGVPATAGALPEVSAFGTPVKTPEQYIAIAQGFFVVGDADGGTIEFNNGQRVFETEASGNSIFMKGEASKTTSSTKTTADVRPKFRIGFEGASITHRQILFTVDENTSDAVDWGYEAEIYEMFDDDMFWTINDKKYVIQASNNVDEDKEIPLGIKSSGEQISIKVDALENVDESTELYIKDNVTGLINDIKNDSFDITLEKGEYLNRFSLVFKPQNTLGVEEEILESGITVFMNNITSELQITNNSDVNIEWVNVYNQLGQIVKYYKNSSKETKLDIPINANSGVYFVAIKTQNGTLSKKIIIK